MILGPTLPTSEFPVWALASKPLPLKWLNKATYRFLFWALWQQERADINTWRKWVHAW